jgi:hypothetical protein
LAVMSLSARERHASAVLRVTRPGAGLVFAVLFGLLAPVVVLTGTGLGREWPLPGTSCAGKLPVHAASLARAFAVR